MAGADRARAARIVHAVIDQGRSLDAVIVSDDNALVRALAYETLRWHRRLEAIAGRLMARRPRQRDISLLRLIEVGIAQLAYFSTPEHAVINETVAAAARLKHARARGMVNAVLRRFQREAEEIERSLPDHPGMVYAYPDWMVQNIERDWPGQHTAVLDALNQRAPMWLRINRRKTKPEAYLEQLAASGIKASSSLFSPYAVRLETPLDVNALPGFEDGWVSVQDLAAQQAAPLLSLDGGQALRVLDACSAPGGKSGHIAEWLADGSRLLALDSSASRQQRTGETLHRLGLKAQIITADAGSPDSWWDGEPFDRILLDAPCSASGVIRRHPDIKSLRLASDIDSLSDTQSQLLNALWPLLRPGGVMLYATCSVFRAENDQQVSAFLAEHDDANDITPECPWGRAMAVGRQILPGDDDMDGFYFAALGKTP